MKKRYIFDYTKMCGLNLSVIKILDGNLIYLYPMLSLTIINRYWTQIFEIKKINEMSPKLFKNIQEPNKDKNIVNN